MSSVILTAAGGITGKATGLPFAGRIGAMVGRLAGSALDQQLFFAGSGKNKVKGARLADLAVQSSTYGRMIPIVYGTVRIGGNMIWSMPIAEHATTTSGASAGGGGKGGGGRSASSTTSYSYSVSCAIAICEGELDEIVRIWADAKLLDLSQYNVRIYKGSQTQTADTLISSIEGADKTPAYRGMAYVVFEDFPLTDFGNRIPNFTFEVTRKSQFPDYEGRYLEDAIDSMVMIPGAGEFVYDTQIATKISGAEIDGQWVQQGSQVRLNMQNQTGTANALLALDQLQATCPNIEYVSVVVSWFGDSLDAGECILMPGVEYQADATVSPNEWSVAGFSRGSARLITQVDGRAQYGGTPDDASLVRFVTEIRNRGLKVAFYPMIFMDMDGKPWRGELTGASADVADFFTKTNGYNAFITHYMNLLDDKVDAFIIGSELKGLTSVSASAGVYPAVDALMDLAADVKATLGSSVVVTYAADWSEYHHTDGGWYNLDPLWASDDIDVIGIDAYFPLTNVQSSLYDIDAIKAGWEEGEGYEYYYTDSSRTTIAALTPEMAWKNIQWFWENTHTNPDLSTTDWVAESKPIWFTELGFPSVDCCTNQPNVFYDPSSGSSGFPYFSKGRVDIRAQRAALMASLEQWRGSGMIERSFIWTWDARPFPYWPDLTSLWADGAAWKTGHWVQGKLGISNLSAIVADLCERAGLSPEMFDTSAIGVPVEGYVIGAQQSIRASIESLQDAFFFDAAESDYILKFVPRGLSSSLEIDGEELLAREDGQSFMMKRAQEVELPKTVNVMYLNRITGYQSATQYSTREITESKDVQTLDLPLVTNDQTAKNIADITLFTRWLSRTSYEFALPPKYLLLEPADVIEVSVNGTTHRMRITSARLVDGAVSVQAVAEDVASYDFYRVPGESQAGEGEGGALAESELALLDLPALPSDEETQANLRVASCGLGGRWNGAAIYRSDDAGSSFSRMTDVAGACVIGTAEDPLGDANACIFDEKHTLVVYVLGTASLSSATKLAVLNGANAAMVGAEIIQFTTATLIGENSYRLAGLLRGRLGTEWAMDGHVAGERFVLLDANLSRIASQNIIGLPRTYKAVTFGANPSEVTPEDFTYQGVALKPYSPVHVSGARDGSGNLSLSWIRRTRIGGQWRDAVDVPLSESAEAYEIDIMDGSNVVRTISASTPSASYSAAEQTTDFSSPQSSLTLRICQLSSLIGRGYAAEAII